MPSPDMGRTLHVGGPVAGEPVSGSAIIPVGSLGMVKLPRNSDTKTATRDPRNSPLTFCVETIGGNAFAMNLTLEPC